MGHLKVGPWVNATSAAIHTIKTSLFQYYFIPTRTSIDSFKVGPGVTLNTIIFHAIDFSFY